MNRNHARYGAASGNGSGKYPGKPGKPGHVSFTFPAIAESLDRDQRSPRFVNVISASRRTNWWLDFRDPNGGSCHPVYFLWRADLMPTLNHICPPNIPWAAHVPPPLTSSHLILYPANASSQRVGEQTRSLDATLNWAGWKYRRYTTLCYALVLSRQPGPMHAPCLEVWLPCEQATALLCLRTGTISRHGLEAGSTRAGSATTNQIFWRSGSCPRISRTRTSGHGGGDYSRWHASTSN